jgi:cytoskeletal protein RodZ
MTTRDHAQPAAAEVRAERARGVTAAREMSAILPERLLAARERKGVDLHRAERDTKIRSHYLAALERGEYRELPGAVYTKGFLRNYALYLGLDPDDVLAQWRRERGDGDRSEPVIAVPRPIVAPRQGLTFSPGIVVAALLTVAVVVFIGYLAVQLLRFARPPTLTVTSPAVAVIEVDEATTSYLLAGSSIPNAVIEITSPGGGQTYQAVAGADGRWSREVELRRGRNQFEVNARDPETSKLAETPVLRFITVPFLVIEAPSLTVESPTEGAAYENGAIPITGRTTNATRVTVAAAYLGPAGITVGAGQTPNPSLPPVTPDPSAPAPSPPPAPPAQQVEPEDDGSFSAPLELTSGRWSITVTAASAEGKTVALTRTVTVAYQGVNVVVTVTGGRAWLKVWVDDVLTEETGSSGRVFADGKTLTFTGERSVKVWTGSSGATSFTLNGENLGTFGRSGVPEVWLFQPPDPPQLLPRA